VRTDACPGQMPSSGPTNIISSGMPEHDCWDGGRLPRSGTFVPNDFSTEAAEICLSRPEAKEKFGGRPD